MKQSTQTALLLLVFLLCVVGLFFTQDPNPDQEYCAMVQLYKDSGGENGWPAYKGDELCATK
jgi:hypothetical protein